jgi:hypothetical protein
MNKNVDFLSRYRRKELEVPSTNRDLCQQGIPI